MAVRHRLALGLLLSCLATLLAHSAAATSTASCSPAGSTILKERNGVQVFIPPENVRDPHGRPWTGGDFVGCKDGSGEWVSLVYEYDSDPEMNPIRISGDWVAFGFTSSCGSCDGYISTAAVVNVVTGARIYERSIDEDRGEGWFILMDIALKPNGSVAFITEGPWRSKRDYRRTVVRHDCNGTRILQTSRRIQKSSLKLLDESTIRWRTGGRERTASIC